MVSFFRNPADLVEATHRSYKGSHAVKPSRLYKAGSCFCFFYLPARPMTVLPLTAVSLLRIAMPWSVCFVLNILSPFSFSSRDNRLFLASGIYSLFYDRF